MGEEYKNGKPANLIKNFENIVFALTVSPDV